MEMLIDGVFNPECQEKTVELNGSPVKYMLAVLHTSSGRLPITVWGERKINFVKTAIKTGEQVKLVVQLMAKPQTYTNHDGEKVTVPNVQLKLYSFVGLPGLKTDMTKIPTESMFQHPFRYPEKIDNGQEQQETWGLPF